MGAVGLAVGLGCQVAGASKVIGIDVNPAKFEIGNEFIDINYFEMWWLIPKNTWLSSSFQ